MKQFPLDIFGSRWVVLIGSHAEIPDMGKNDSGSTDFTVREIAIEDMTGTEGPGRWKDMNAGMKETLRHEIAHAALIECGLCTNRTFDHEQVADWMATKVHALHAVIVYAESTFDLIMKETQDGSPQLA